MLILATCAAIGALTVAIAAYLMERHERQLTQLRLNQREIDYQLLLAQVPDPEPWQAERQILDNRKRGTPNYTYNETRDGTEG